jgi:hypothetical protein
MTQKVNRSLEKLSGWSLAVDFGGVLAQFVDSEGAHCSVGAEAALSRASLANDLPSREHHLHLLYAASAGVFFFGFGRPFRSRARRML